jgi:hypothetical protein
MKCKRYGWASICWVGGHDLDDELLEREEALPVPSVCTSVTSSLDLTAKSHTFFMTR